jgi:uncharacterized membrane protein
VSEPHRDFEKLLGPDRRSIPRPKGLSAVVLAIGVAVVAGLIALWPRGDVPVDLDVIGFADESPSAQVVSVEEAPCPYATDLTCSTVDLVVTSGTHEGEEVMLEFPDEPGQPELAVGDSVFLSVVELEDGTISFQYADKDRRILLGVLALVFGLTVIALGRMRGVAALAGLLISIAVLMWFILPAIISGRDAVLVALVGGAAIVLVSLYLAHGFTPLTHAAALGAFAALTLTVLLSSLVVTLAEFTGLAGDEAFFLIALPDIDPRGLLLAGIVLGALGAMDDVTVTQASAVWEVREANPDLDSDSLYSAGMRVGRDHIVSTVNTLLLAYAGASLPLLLLFSLSAQPLGVVASSEVVAVEIVRTLVGSIGLVAAVPVTTWLSARIAARRQVT